MLSRLLRSSPWPPALLAAAALVLFVGRSLAAPDRPAGQPPRDVAPGVEGFPAELGERIGDRRLAGFELAAARDDDDAAAELIFMRGGLRIRVWVVPRGGWPHSPPMQSESYDLFYGDDRADGEGPTDAEVEALLRALVPVLDRS